MGRWYQAGEARSPKTCRASQTCGSANCRRVSYSGTQPSGCDTCCKVCDLRSRGEARKAYRVPPCCGCQERFGYANRVKLLGRSFHTIVLSVQGWLGSGHLREEALRGLQSKFAVPDAIQHVYRYPDDGPDKESNPSHPGKEIHQAEAGQHP